MSPQPHHHHTLHIVRYEVGESSSAAAARPAGGFRANYGFIATMDRKIMRDPEREIGYGITDSWDEIGHVTALQGQVTALQAQVTTLRDLLEIIHSRSYQRRLVAID
nr:hypothetical protein [Tanacetum cinerariifolium]